jgi:starch synthase
MMDPAHMNGSVLVSHPHAAAFAVATATALESRGQLAALATGLAAVKGSRRASLLGKLASGRGALSNRILEGIRPEHLISMGTVEALARGAGWLTRHAGGRGPRSYDAIFWAHDRAVASMTWPSDVSTVYAYEDAALASFGTARRRGVRCVWDLPLPHWRTLDTMWREESRRWPGAMGDSPPIEPAWKTQRKDSELALADQVSVASEFTRQSLENAGSMKPVIVLPYGFPVERFGKRSEAPGGPFTVLSVGTHDLRKGTPYLLEAWRQSGIRNGRLRLVGPLKLTKAFLDRYAGLFEHVPHLPRAQLEAEYQAADLLAFPTLGDGFGLVIQEAMCCGTPVVTTGCGGGPACIENETQGFIVPDRNVDALVDVFRRAASDRDALATMGVAARQRAERWTWTLAASGIVAALCPGVDPPRT